MDVIKTQVTIRLHRFFFDKALYGYFGQLFHDFSTSTVRPKVCVVGWQERRLASGLQSTSDDDDDDDNGISRAGYNDNDDVGGGSACDNGESIESVNHRMSISIRGRHESISTRVQK